MDFDFARMAVPFRMQPGLARVAADTLVLTPLDPASSLYAQKLAVLEAGSSRQVVPGFDAGPALAAIAERSALSAFSGPAPGTPVELAYEEDLVVLDGATGTLPWLCVCVPSHWVPEEKLGLDFATLHAPVADNAMIVKASQQLVALATNGDCWERFVWTLSSAGLHDQHPHRHARAPWPPSVDAEAFARQCWLRWERQVFFPVGRGTRQSVFAIRVMVQPLVEAVRTPQHAARMHDSLASMSEAVLAYKSITEAREPLLRWLKDRC